MKKPLFCAFVLLFFFALAPHAAGAADIACADESCAALWLSGEIVAGDAQKFSAALDRAGGGVKGVMLSSPGGSPQEAMKLGRLIRERGFFTQAPAADALGGMLGEGPAPLCRGADCVCASACFLVWAAGVERHGNMLGIHRPAPDFGSHRPSFAARIYREAALMPALLALLGDVRGYLDEMDVPQRYIDRMTRAPDAGTYWLSAEEAGALAAPPG